MVSSPVPGPSLPSGPWVKKTTCHTFSQLIPIHVRPLRLLCSVNPKSSFKTSSFEMKYYIFFINLSDIESNTRYECTGNYIYDLNFKWLLILSHPSPSTLHNRHCLQLLRSKVSPLTRSTVFTRKVFMPTYLPTYSHLGSFRRFSPLRPRQTPSPELHLTHWDWTVKQRSAHQIYRKSLYGT